MRYFKLDHKKLHKFSMKKNYETPHINEMPLKKRVIAYVVHYI